MKDDKFPNEIEKIDIDVSIPEPVVTIEEKRERTARRFARFNIAVFSIIMASVSVFMVTVKRPKVSETENRNLAAFPEYSQESLLNGSYTDGIATYYNDTVPMRSTFKNLAATFKSYAGIEKDGVKVYTINRNPDKNKDKNNSKPAQTEKAPSAVITASPDFIAQFAPAVTTEATTVVTTEPPPPPIPEDDRDDAGELSNDIMIFKNRGIPIYYGSFDAGVEYASILNQYKLDLGDNVNVYSMVCPTAISFYWPESSDISHGSEADNMQNIREHLVGVEDVNILDILKKHRTEHIYSRTDHHWQPLGAYYAASEFAKKANVPFDDLSKYEEVSVPGYVGTLYGFSGAAVLNDNPEDFVFYRPDNQYTTHYYSPSFEHWYDGELLIEAYGSSLYLTFMGGDEKITHVETDAPNDRTLFILKDSYGNALVPFLTNSFKNIYVLDMRYFNLNSVNFMKEHGATDVLFAMNTFSATGSNYRNLEVIRNQ
ncbi:MAG: DHHW family protein [Bacteroidaceae bacterium]|nr:DHHW family protein [Bacteroidaceae bacterium]